MAKNSTKTTHRKQNRKSRNIKPALLLLAIPLAAGITTVILIGGGVYSRNISRINNERLATPNWQAAQKTMTGSQPNYQRKYAFYKVKEGQTLETIANYFGVDLQELTKLNPGTVTYGTNIKIPPIQKPLTPAASNGLIGNAVVSDKAGMLRVTNKYSLRQPIITSLPEIARLLAPYNAIQKVGDSTYRINRAVSIDGDIRIDITDKTVQKIELRSEPNNITCLCMDGSLALIDHVVITTYDPTTQKPDTNTKDGRSFVRMKNGRMDMTNSDLRFLGNGLDGLKPTSHIYPPQREGGVYGVSWRISDDRLGSDIATGWVEKNRFHDNYFGAYSFGASGMIWRGNHFFNNEIYGLDPHDDSNNALIENNVFSHNGKHGFIVSKRCNYNIIRNNTSYDNKLHGFMLHQDSAYNVIENNVAYGNTDNFVIYNSNFNTIRDNISYAPRSSHVRINKVSVNNYVTGNQFIGGRTGIYLYDGVVNTYVANNQVVGVNKVLSTRHAHNTFFGGNTVSNLNYSIGPSDRFIFGLNTVSGKKQTIPVQPPLPKNYTL